MSAKPTIEPTGGGVVLRVRVQPRASRENLHIDDSGAVRVSVTVPPADDQANKAVLSVVAKKLGIARSRIRIRSGQRSRDKTLLIEGVDLERVSATLQPPRKENSGE